MVTTKLDTEALSRLCSKDQMDLLDAVDRLRSYGVDDHVSLPQIIVCGDQSSGKSSVLEAISHVSFPVKSNVCTRFPTELVLRRASHTSSSVSIVPHASRSENERKSLEGFHQELDGFDRLAGLIEAAKIAMGIHGGKAFSKDLLKIEITGPDRPHLTIVDLPGLIHSETKHQTKADVDLIQDVVKEYMKEPRSVILAVISAKNDLANQIVLNLARAADPTGNRTMGIITKPDTLIPGSSSETFYASLARNEEVEFRLGWHVLKNMDTDKGVFTVKKRDEEEKQFFSDGIWNELPSALLGITELNGRLSKVLLKQIAQELPNVIKEIGSKLKHCQEQIDKLGLPRTTVNEQIYYLMQVSQSFQTLVKAAVDGTYNDTFFDDPKSDCGYKQRIRAVIQNLNRDFANEMSERGHYRQITATATATEIGSTTVYITREDFIDHIQELMRRTRGRELPCTFSPLIVSNLFKEQSHPWGSILENHVQKVFEATEEFTEYLCWHISDSTAAPRLLSDVIRPALDGLMESMNQKAKELLLPHEQGHPITYNQQFFETLQKSRDDRRRDMVLAAVTAHLGVDEASLKSTTHYFYDNRAVNLDALVDALAKRSESDIDRLAASEALDCMDAYYKVALKRFLDDVAVELVETKLIAPLASVLLPQDVFSWPTDRVESIAGESEENKRQREQLQKQLDVLNKGSDFCKRFLGLRIGGEV
ncbi:unnamed protein product [Discula destructiva]